MSISRKLLLGAIPFIVAGVAVVFLWDSDDGRTIVGGLLAVATVLLLGGLFAAVGEGEDRERAREQAEWETEQARLDREHGREI